MNLIIQDKQSSGRFLSTGERLFEELKKILGWDPEFYELKIPLFVVAADKNSQQSVILRHGKVFDAVRASIAMPLILEEKQMGGMQLADGAIFSPLDTGILYSEGADFVIAIQAKPIRSSEDRSMPLRKKLEPRMLRMLGWQTDPEIYFSKPACDILLRPRVPQDWKVGSKEINDIIQLGIKITFDAMHELGKESSAPIISPPSQESDVAEQAKLNADTIEKLAELTMYLQQIGQKTAAMSDAELMKIFPEFSRRFQAFLKEVEEKYPNPEAAHEALKEKLKDFAKLVDHSPFVSRCLHKPLGYAGDYQMMNYLYDDEVLAAQSNMGKLINYFTFSSPAANAVRNRAKIIQGVVQYKLAEQPQLAVASIACGPAREVAATLKLLTEDMAAKMKIVWTLLDQDKEALESARQNIPPHIALTPNFVNAGVKQLLKNEVSLGSQDLIYSFGLFDYLEDKVATSLIKRLYAQLNPGGMLFIGNFHPRNSSRLFMEAVTEWYLIHRTEEELLALGKAAAPEGRHFVIAEPEGINIILVTSKPLNPK